MLGVHMGDFKNIIVFNQHEYYTDIRESYNKGKKT